MQIKNIGAAERQLSVGGVTIPLFPGASTEVDLTKDEAKAIEALGLEVTGEPVKPALKAKE
jgi:hypothetical protein